MSHNKFLWRNLSVGIEEILLGLIIILNILDAFEILPGDLDYVKKIISWSALGYLLYKVDMSKLFMGVKNTFANSLLLAGYFCLIIKDLISYAMVALPSASSFLREWYVFLTVHATSIETGGIYLGIFILAYTVLHMTSRLDVKKPSILSMMGCTTKLHFKTAKEKIIYFCKKSGALISVIVLFFVIIFNLFMEWLAIAIDAPLLMIGLAAYILFVVKHHKKFKATSVLAKFGNFGESLYKDVVEHLKYKSTVFRALVGMLVLHVVTDFLIYIVPFLFGVADQLYHGLFTQVHPWIMNLFIGEIIQTSLLNGLALSVLYVGNLVGILFLLLFPIAMWFSLYKNKRILLNPTMIASIFFGITSFVLAPLFNISALTKTKVYGVDILGQEILPHARIDVVLAALFALIAGFLVFELARSKKVRVYLSNIIIYLSQVGFSIYCALFFYSIAGYYTTLLPLLASFGKITLLVFFSLLFIATALFYIVGIISFVEDTHDHMHDHLEIKD